MTEGDFVDYSLPYFPQSQPLSSNSEEAAFSITPEAPSTNCPSKATTTLDPLLDFFFEVNKGICQTRLLELLEAAWDTNEEISLKLIFQLRDVRDGKGLAMAFIQCLLWLLEEHPLTLAYNLEFVPKYGCWKDLLELLKLTLWRKGGEVKNPRMPTPSSKNERREKKREKRINNKKLRVDIQKKKAKPRKERMKKGWENDAAVKEAAAIDRKRFHAWQRELVRNSMVNDSLYRWLHLRIAKMFAKQMTLDYQQLKEGGSVSLAAKWAPTPNQHHDRICLIASTIAELLYPMIKFGQSDQTRAQFIGHVRRRYQQRCLNPLRSYLQLTERKMTAGEWGEIDYSKVPSICMFKKKELFKKHDEQRFTTWLKQVQCGVDTITTGGVGSNPGRIVQEIQRCQDKTGLFTLEQQWKAISAILEKNNGDWLKGCLVCCDVSTSLKGESLNAAIALTLLISQLADPPFRNEVLTFADKPQFVKLSRDGLLGRIRSLNLAGVGDYNPGGTDYQAIFKLILKKSPDVVSKLVILSDMDFSSSTRIKYNKTDHEAIKALYKRSGKVMPEIVYWNLGTCHNKKPINKHETGIKLISGFSGNLLKYLLEGKLLTEGNPYDVLTMVTEGKYMELKVLD